MNQGRIIVITGAPGTGKTTTASVVAKESDLEKSVHMHTDDFYHYLSKGAIHEQKYKGNTAEHAKGKALREDSIRQGIVGHSISDAGALI